VLAPEHTLHGDAAAITALPLVARFAVGSFVTGSAPQAAAHVNLVFGCFITRHERGGVVIARAGDLS